MIGPERQHSGSGGPYEPRRGRPLATMWVHIAGVAAASFLGVVAGAAVYIGDLPSARTAYAEFTRAEMRIEDRNGALIAEMRRIDPETCDVDYGLLLRKAGVRKGAVDPAESLVESLFLGWDTPGLRRQAKGSVTAFWLRRVFSDSDLRLAQASLGRVGDLGFGAETAAQSLFGASACDLGLAQAAILAGWLANPDELDPRARPGEAMQAATDLIDALAQNAEISFAARDQAFHEPVRMKRLAAPPYNRADLLSLAMPQIRQVAGDEVGSLTVRLSIDIGMQSKASSALAASASPAAAIVVMDVNGGLRVAATRAGDSNAASAAGLAAFAPGDLVEPFAALALALENNKPPAEIEPDHMAAVGAGALNDAAKKAGLAQKAWPRGEGNWGGAPVDPFSLAASLASLARGGAPAKPSLVDLVRGEETQVLFDRLGKLEEDPGSAELDAITIGAVREWLLGRPMESRRGGVDWYGQVWDSHVTLAAVAAGAEPAGGMAGPPNRATRLVVSAFGGSPASGMGGADAEPREDLGDGRSLVSLDSP